MSAFAPASFVVALTTPEDTLLYWRSRQRWVSSPRNAAHLTQEQAEQVLKRLTDKFTVPVEILRNDDAIEFAKGQ